MLDRPLDINGKHIIISQDLSLSHAGTVWDGALTLVYYWEKNKSVAKQLIEHKRVLELGSGTGIVGLTACAFSPTSLID